MNEFSGPGNKIDQMLLTIWRKNYPILIERVGLLRKACSALAGNTLDEATRSDAHAAAHKLAGVLGTFGLKEGSILASELENSLDAPAELPEKQDFCASVEKLAAMIETKPR